MALKDNCLFTPFWRFDVVDVIVDDELEVFVQQRVDQRGVGYALAVCQEEKDDGGRSILTKVHGLLPQTNDLLQAPPEG